MKTAINIPKVSYIFEFLNKNNTFIPNAINSILIIGSFNDSNKKKKNVYFFLLVISLEPYLFLEIDTSLFDKPLDLLVLTLVLL